VGYTPELVTGVWLGNDTPSRMYSVWGGNGCAPIWRRYMRKALSVVPRRPDITTYQPPKPKETQPEEQPLQASNPAIEDAPEWNEIHPSYRLLSVSMSPSSETTSWQAPSEEGQDANTFNDPDPTASRWAFNRGNNAYGQSEFDVSLPSPPG
jgi:membrane peptidoglycan carboxypeptidase